MKYYNKINRNLKVRARLYFNQLSHNRVLDTTPRYFVKIDSLKSLERIGFTQKSENNQYVRYASNFYGAKKEEYLSQRQVENILLDLNSKAPYGYNTGISGSLQAYNDEVKFNSSYQSFYNNFWNDNLSRVTADASEQYPYMEVELNEVIKSKFLVKEPASYADYSPPVSEDDASYYNPNLSIGTYSCDENTNIVVTTGVSPFSFYGFVVDGIHRTSLNLGRNKQYTFTNTNLFHQESCQTGVLPFRISEGSSDGVLNGGSTYTSGVNVSGAGTLTGAEVLVLTTDENTPNSLGYHSPLYPDMGANIAILDGCSGVAGSVTHPSFTPYAIWNSGTVPSTDSSKRTVASTGNPNHCTHNSSRGWTGYPNMDSTHGISGQSYEWEIPLNPVLPASGQNSRVPLGAIGVALNGLPLHNAYDLSGNDLVNSEFKDNCNGFVSFGKYMYRQDPICTYVDVSGEHSPIVGYAFDGYPIYGSRDESGIHIDEDDLDMFHGHNQEGRGYHYHVTTGAPYVLGAYYKGVPTSGNFEDTNSPAITGYPIKYRSL